MLTGIAKRIDELEATDQAFLQNHCEGHEEWFAGLRETAWSDIEQRSGVTQAEIDAVAQVYAKAKNVVFSWTMWSTQIWYL